MPIRFTVKGVKEVRRNLRRLGKKANAALTAGLYREGEVIMRASKHLCPVDEGTLRSTGHVRGPYFGAGIVKVLLRYGGPSAPYALVQHENMNYRHNPPTQAKYLETPAKAAVSGMARRMAKRIRTSLERG